ncbi:MAG: hypothetical protein OXC95_04965 [Dehalococcoidia bacterium]|nr:hypothetical protein [Dehalococcoidia bacterium]
METAYYDYIPYDTGLIAALIVDGVPTGYAASLSSMISRLETLLKLAGGRDHSGRHWTYQSYEGLSAYFPAMSVRTVKRVVAVGVDKGYILKQRRQRENEYALDYRRLIELFEYCNIPTPHMTFAS